MNERVFSSRKFLIVATLAVATIAGLFLGKLTGGEFVTLAGVMIGAYNIADVGEKFIQSRAS